MMTLNGLTLDNSPIFRRVIQVVCDLARRPLSELRILDLGSAHGAYSIELARRGAHVLGIEGREAWLEQACRAQQNASLTNVEFVRDDVRNLSKEKYGEFDVVLCLGILYHLNAPDVFEFVEKIADVCRDFVVIETKFAAAPVLSHVWRENRYWGMSTCEHPPGANSDDKLKNLGASLDNENSFEFTRYSLCNILRHVGFTSVYDCVNPMAYLSVGAERQFKMWGNRLTLTAVKGQSVSLSAAPELDWPENVDEHLFEQFLREREGNVRTTPLPRRIARRLLSPFSRRA